MRSYVIKICVKTYKIETENDGKSSAWNEINYTIIQLTKDYATRTCVLQSIHG